MISAATKAPVTPNASPVIGKMLKGRSVGARLRPDLPYNYQRAAAKQRQACDGAWRKLRPAAGSEAASCLRAGRPPRMARARRASASSTRSSANPCSRPCRRPCSRPLAQAAPRTGSQTRGPGAPRRPPRLAGRGVAGRGGPSHSLLSRRPQPLRRGGALQPAKTDQGARGAAEGRGRCAPAPCCARREPAATEGCDLSREHPPLAPDRCTNSSARDRDSLVGGAQRLVASRQDERSGIGA
jgi:hypothetical protein